MSSNNIDTATTSVKGVYLASILWIRYMISKWYIFLSFGLAGGVLGGIYANARNPIYVARTTFVLESNNKSGGIGQLMGVASMMGYNVGAGGEDLFSQENIYELYKSDKMLVRTLLSNAATAEGETLLKRYVDISGIRSTWEDSNDRDLLNIDFDSVKLGHDRLTDSVIMSVSKRLSKENITVEKLERGSILKVSVKSYDETFSKEFNEQLVSTVNDFYVQTKVKKTADNVKLLQLKVDSVQRIMTNSISSAASVSDQTPNLNPTRQAARQVPIQNAQFTAEVNRKVLEQLVQNLEIAKMSLLNEEPLIEKVDTPYYPLEVQKISIVKGGILGFLMLGFCAFMIISFRYLFINAFLK